MADIVTLSQEVRAILPCYPAFFQSLFPDPPPQGVR